MATSDGDDVASFASFCWPPPPALPLAFPRFLFGLCLFFLACMAKTRLLTSALLFIFYMLFCFLFLFVSETAIERKNNKKKEEIGVNFISEVVSIALGWLVATPNNQSRQQQRLEVFSGVLVTRNVLET